MSLSNTVKETLAKATAKALATDGPHGINVVPISMIKVNNDSIWLFDFFMNKTVLNIATNTSVALVAWTDMAGIQVKAEASYITQGAEFESAVNWVLTQNPNRVTKGLLVLKPTAVFDVSPGGMYAAEDLTI
jgi:predicted pyridoxine 5'-phosphate oxidase superfamily flavin-nucleotide-binding protein